ncbi:MAG: hypothetical protein H8E47_09710 [Anaerolineales bacterium]|nr:hypothetical protein [Anaerolineales bacterium]
MPGHKVSVSSRRKILTYAYLYEGARFSIEQAEASEEGSFYNCMSAIILCAFCIEAYLNHIGSELLPYWDAVERCLRPRDKLEIFDHNLDLRMDLSRRPFQSFTTIFKFRNAVAHGRTEVLLDQSIQKVSKGKRVKHPETKWEKLCTVETVKKLLADAETIIAEIHKKAGQGEYPLASLGSATAWISPVRNLEPPDDPP